MGGGGGGGGETGFSQLSLPCLEQSLVLTAEVSDAVWQGFEWNHGQLHLSCRLDTVGYHLLKNPKRIKKHNPYVTLIRKIGFLVFIFFFFFFWGGGGGCA